MAFWYMGVDELMEARGGEVRWGCWWLENARMVLVR